MAKRVSALPCRRYPGYLTQTGRPPESLPDELWSFEIRNQDFMIFRFYVILLDSSSIYDLRRFKNRRIIVVIIFHFRLDIYTFLHIFHLQFSITIFNYDIMADSRKISVKIECTCSDINYIFLSSLILYSLFSISNLLLRQLFHAMSSLWACSNSRDALHLNYVHVVGYESRNSSPCRRAGKARRWKPGKNVRGLSGRNVT